MKIFITLSLLYLTLANQEILSVVGDQKYPFQQVIVALSEVALKDFNFQQLFVALDELAESFKGRKNEENAFYDQEYQQYYADLQYDNIKQQLLCLFLIINFQFISSLINLFLIEPNQNSEQVYQNQITDFKNKIAQLEVDVKDLTDERARSQYLLLEAKQDLYDATKLFNAKEAQIKSDKSTFT